MNLALNLTLAGFLVLQISIELINLVLQCPLFFVEVCHFLTEFLFIRRRHVKFADRLLNFLHAALLIFFEHSAFSVKLLLALATVSINFLLMVLINAEFGQLQGTFFVFSDKRELGLLTFEFRFKLFD